MTPLDRRLPREFRHNLGKYLGIFFLLFLTIALVSGFLVAARSIQRVIADTRAAANLRDFSLTTQYEAHGASLARVRSLHGGIDVEEEFCSVLPLTHEGQDQSRELTARICTGRENMDKVTYRYAARFRDRGLSLKDRTTYEGDVSKGLADDGVTVTDLLDHEADNAITFVDDDLASDQKGYETILFLLVVISAFIFVAYFDPCSFVETTVAPFVLLVVVTLAGVRRKLSATPLASLRHEVGAKSRRTSLRLPERWSYVRRFRTRVFLRDVPHFAVLFLGIVLSSMLMLFGLAMLPLVHHAADQMASTVRAQYLCTLKAPLGIDETSEQLHAAAALKEIQSVEDPEEDIPAGRLASLMKSVSAPEGEAHAYNDRGNTSHAIAHRGGGEHGRYQHIYE